jgi:PKD repeat protein
MQEIFNRTRCPGRFHAGRIALALMLVAVLSMAGTATADPLPDFNNICIGVANNAGVKYDTFGNDTYSIRFEGIDRGLNALHISTDPGVNFGQVTETDAQSGTFYATDSGGKGYEDDIILMVSVNGTIPDDFALHVVSDGYSWTPNPISNQPPPLGTVTYQPVGLDETFTAEDFIYGPQTWKPTGNETEYPIYAGQNTDDTSNTFRLMFVDLNSGVLRPNTTLQNQGAVRISYSFQNHRSFAAFSVYGYCNNSNNGETMIAWTNALHPAKPMSGYSVRGIPTPDADFGAEPQSGNAPLTVNFTDTSTGDGITGYQWVLGDDSSTIFTDPNLTHIFTSEGVFSVNHSVTNVSGTSWTNRTNYITVTSPPAPDVTAINPTKHKRNGKAFTAAISGTGFQPGIPGTDVTLSRGVKIIGATNVNATSATRLTCSFRIPKKAKTGLYTVTVTNPDGLHDTLPKVFTVTA